MLDMGVLDVINSMKKNKVLKVHPYTITEPHDNKSRWQTYVKNDKGERQKISSTTELGLYNKLYEIYYVKNECTLMWLFPQWIEFRKSIGISPNTVRRNKYHWNKYYLEHKIINTPLNKLNVEQIEQFFYYCITTYNLTVKELANMKFVFSDMMKFAFKKKYIAYNVFQNVEIRLNGCKPQDKKNDSSRVYYHDEKELLFSVLEEEIKMYPNKTEVYAIYLQFKLGLRIGELVALKWEDVDFINREIHIHRMETRADTKEDCCTYSVVNYTKKKSIYGDRFLPLGNYEIELMEKIKVINEQYNYQENEYVFCDNKGRITSRKIDSFLRRMCGKAQIEEKSTHDIRRTVASEMFNNGVPIEIVQCYLGHSDTKTTYGYIFNNKHKDETNKLILSSLENMNGLKRTQIA